MLFERLFAEQLSYVHITPFDTYIHTCKYIDSYKQVCTHTVLASLRLVPIKYAHTAQELLSQIHSVVQIWLQLYRQTKTLPYESGFEKRGNFARNAKIWQFPSYHNFKAVRASDFY